jgi:hypothetical protein
MPAALGRDKRVIRISYRRDLDKSGDDSRAVRSLASGCRKTIAFKACPVLSLWLGESHLLFIIECFSGEPLGPIQKILQTLFGTHVNASEWDHMAARAWNTFLWEALWRP